MTIELYYLIAKFLSAGPCKESAEVLERELDQQRQLLPHTMTYDGSHVPLTMERLNKKYPGTNGQYLLSLMEHFLQHYKETADTKTLRGNALRHGDESLLTMLSAFVPSKHYEKSNYLTMSLQELANLSVHRMLIAREMGATVMHETCTQTSLSTFYKERVTLNGHRYPVFCLAFDKTNRRLFTGSDDYLVKVWCVRTGYLIYTIRGHYNVITDIAINEENTLIATASSDGYVRVWTMDGYKQVVCLRPISANAKPFTTVRFSPSPKAETRYLMATNEDGYVRLWKWNRDTLHFSDSESPITFSCKFRARDKLRCSSFNYTGTKFTVAGDDGFVYVFSTIKSGSADSGRPARNTNKTSSQEGKRRRRVASALFPDKTGQGQQQPIEPIAILEGHMGSVTDLAFSHDGQRILSGSQDGTARIWSYSKEEATWKCIVLDIKETPDAPVVKPLSHRTITEQAFDSSTSTSSFQQELSEFGTLIPPLSPDLKESQSCSQEVPSAILVDSMVDSSQPNVTNVSISANADHQDVEESPKVSMITWSADDRLCIVATTHGDIKVYYACNGQPSSILKGHRGEIYAVDSHPQDPNTILSAGYDGNAILWDIKRQKVITWRNHPGRVFLDCKFSKDGMKYAITDDEGSCTLFGINGLEKDYAQTKNWTRGQYFYNDYLPVRYSSDGSFVDEQTNLPTDKLPSSPIIDLQGIEYPHQPRRGYGRDITIQSASFDIEDLQRSVYYNKEEQDMRKQPAYLLPVMDRAQIAKRRREFVKTEEDDENDTAGAGNMLPPFQPPIPTTQAYLLPDDSDDEDYREDANNGQIADSSEEDSETETGENGSDEFMAPAAATMDQWDESETEDRPPVTRSRAGQLRNHSGSPEFLSSDEQASRITGRRGRPPRTTAVATATASSVNTRGRSSSSTRTANLATGNSSSNNDLSRRTSNGHRMTRTTRKRRREIQIQSDDDEDSPLRPRRRLRMPPKSYLESDPDDFDESDEESVNITDLEYEDRQQHTMAFEAGPSTSVASRRVARTTRSVAVDNGSDDDDDDDEVFQVPSARRTTKRRYQPRSSDEEGEDVVIAVQSSHAASTASAAQSIEGVQRQTRAQQHQQLMLQQTQTQPRQQQQQQQQQQQPQQFQYQQPQSSSTSSKLSSKVKGKKRTSESKPSKRKLAQNRSNTLRNLTEDEIRLYSPSPWISMTHRSVEKYLPQLGDRVALLVEGHKQYWEQSEMTEYFDERHGLFETKSNDPVVFALVTSISWHIGPPSFCRLKLLKQELTNLRSALIDQATPHWSTPSSSSSPTSARGRSVTAGGDEITLDYCDEDGCPEFLVLWERFQASMAIFFGPSELHERVDAMYDVGKYTGRVSTINQSGMYWQRAKSQSPWACYHIIWDDDSSPPEDLSPWEVVPLGESFSDWYDVGTGLTDQEISRARSVLNWISNTEDFMLYVHQVDYYMYPNYLSKIAYPICLDLVTERLNNGYYRRLEALIDDVELIRKNAQNYNHPTSLAFKNAARMANFFKTRMQNPRMPLSLGRSRKTQEEDDEYDDANVHEESEDSGPEGKEAIMMDEDSDESDAFIDDDDENDD